MSQEPKVTRFGVDPTVAQELATKNYVDTSSSGGLTFARVVKIVAQTVNNSDTVQDDDELVVPLNANKVYHIFIMICFTSGTTPDFKYQISIPAGATADRQDGQWVQTRQNAQDWTTEQVSAGQNAVVQWNQQDGRIITGGTAGNVVLQWAQNVATASDTIVLPGSLVILWEES